MGHILPFELVQNALMQDDVDALRQKEERLSEIALRFRELLEELPEEEREKDFVNESKDAFVPAEVKKAFKAGEDDPITLMLLEEVNGLVAEEKSVRRELREDTERLHIATKAKIESLADGEARDMLKRKWIRPLAASMEKLPENIVSDFVKKLDTLCHKYDSTLAEIERQISDTQRTLVSMLNGLTANEFDRKGLDELKILLGGE